MPTQLAMFAPESTKRAPPPEQWPRWGQASRVSVDLECKDEQLFILGPGCRRPDSFIAGVGVAIDDGPSVYLPIAHHGGDNVENAIGVWQWMHDNAQEFKGELVGANLAYDLDWLLMVYHGRQSSPDKPLAIRWPKIKRYWDVLINDCLIYELHRRGNLDAVAERWGIVGKNKAGLLAAAKHYGLTNPMGEMWKLPGRYVIDYNLADLRIPLELLPKMLAMMETMKLMTIADIESRLIPVLVKMRQRGIKVNANKLQAIESWSIKEEKEIIARIKDATGADMMMDEFTNSESIARILEKQGVRVARDQKGKASIDEEFLARCEHPSGKMFLRGRQMDNLRNKYSRPTFDHMVNGRIHCVYNQVRGTEEKKLDGGAEKQKGARTGRMSAEHTNMTNQPSRQDWAKRWKELFEPEEGYYWFSNDYAAQEPRLTTHYAALLDLPKAREVAAAYRRDPLLDNHQFMADLTGLHRDKAKPVYLGLIYSMGESKLCRSLGLPTQFVVSYGPWSNKTERFFSEYSKALAYRQSLEEENIFIGECAGPEGKAVLETFHARAPFLKALVQRAMSNGRKHGEIITLLGRHLHLPMLDNGKYDWIHKCLNMLIQGSAADQMKKAMVDVDDQMPHLWLQLQVHDMLGGSCKTREEAKEVGRIMRNAVISEYVPYRVDTGWGPSWGQEQSLCYEMECMVTAISSKKKYCEAHAPRMAA